jgi:hypothetical protein
LLVFPWWHLGLCRASPSRGVVVAVGCRLLSLAESVWQEWCSTQKPPLSVAMVATALEASLSLLRAPLTVIMSLQHDGYHVLAARGFYGENPVLCGRATTTPFGIVTFSEALHLETRLNLWQWCWPAGGVAWCVVGVVVCLVRVGREVQRAHGGVASSWHIWCTCSGNLGDGWAEVLLSK